MRRVFAIVLLCQVMLAACEEEIETPGSEDFQPAIVVEGVFTNEIKIQTLKLTTSTKVNYEGDPAPVSNAVVNITDGSVVISMIEKVSGSGVYESAFPVGGTIGKTYTLTLTHGGRTYTASDRMMPSGSAEAVPYTKVDNEFYEWSVPNNHTLQPGTTFEWQVEVTHPKGPTNVVTYYNFTGLETSALFALNQMSMSLRFRAGTKIVQRKMSLSPEFYEYLKAVYSETVWKGDLYDVSPANVPTNLSNGAHGFFRVSAVTQTEQIVE